MIQKAARVPKEPDPMLSYGAEAGANAVLESLAALLRRA